MQAAMAKAKAGQSSEGEPHTIVQQAIDIIRQCSGDCALDGHVLVFPAAMALLAGSVSWSQPRFPCSRCSSR